jgi:hypothetical protein|tara:strand:- start:67 stop:774 length:708 start_codon:yes stop_codon:yes gene_type:complete
MANRKKNHRWNQVMPGDIISFKYGPKSKAKPIKTQTILVLNPKITVKLKNGKTTKQLIGIKIEESNRQILAMSKRVVNLFQKIGEFRIIDKGNSIYHLQIKQTFLINEFVGVKQEVFRMLVQGKIKELYRTYDYNTAKASAVYYEPIKIPQAVVDEFHMLVENEATTRPGDVWERKDGWWAGKNIKGFIVAYKLKSEAFRFANDLKVSSRSISRRLDKASKMFEENPKSDSSDKT